MWKHSRLGNCPLHNDRGTFLDNSSAPSGVGGPPVNVLLSLVNEKRNCLGLLIRQNLGRRGKLKGMLGERKPSQGEAINPCLRQMPPVRIFASKPLLRGDIQINRKGLN